MSNVCLEILIISYFVVCSWTQKLSWFGINQFKKLHVEIIIIIINIVSI